MEYVCVKRFRGTGIDGAFNIPYGSVLTLEHGTMFYKTRCCCLDTSENAHEFFSWNGDGAGLRRGKLIHAVKERLAQRDASYQARWDLVWNDPISRKYQRHQVEGGADLYADYWLWGQGFYTAGIDDLEHIAGLIGAKED